MLAAAIKKLDAVDLIIAGRQAVDWDMGVVGSTIAEILGLPVVTIAKEVKLDGGKVTVERVLLDGFETVEAPTPAVVTVSNELGEPRYPQLRQIMMAAKKEVKAWGLADLGISAPANRVTPRGALRAGHLGRDRVHRRRERRRRRPRSWPSACARRS